MRLGYWLFFLILILPATPRADVMLNLSADPLGTNCDVAYPGLGGVVTVHVLLRHSYNEASAGVAFAAPVPPTSGLTHVRDSSPYYFTGNSQSGISVGFGDCEGSATLLVLTMDFVRTSAGAACTPYMTSPDVSHLACTGGQDIYAGDGVVLSSDGSCSHVTLPSGPVPPDGSTNVPLSGTLTWEEADYICNGMLCGNDDEVYFGTTPDPPLLGNHYGGQAAYGALQPGTTYYWRARTGCPWSNVGPVWSFTTTTDVAIRPSTWGAIKALYR